MHVCSVASPGDGWVWHLRHSPGGHRELLAAITVPCALRATSHEGDTISARRSNHAPLPHATHPDAGLPL
jgi:hypothetical protein